MAGVILFGSVKYGEAVNRQANFSTALKGIYLETKKIEGCYLCCVACGGYMQGKTCNGFFHSRHCSVQCFDSSSN